MNTRHHTVSDYRTGSVQGIKSRDVNLVGPASITGTWLAERGQMTPPINTSITSLFGALWTHISLEERDGRQVRYNILPWKKKSPRTSSYVTCLISLAYEYSRLSSLLMTTRDFPVKPTLSCQERRLYSWAFFTGRIIVSARNSTKISFRSKGHCVSSFIPGLHLHVLGPSLQVPPSEEQLRQGPS